MRKTVKWALFAAALLLLIGTAVYMYYLGTRPSEETVQAEQAPVPVTARRLARRDFTARDEYAARLEAVRDITVTARVNGTIVKDLIDEGDRVEKDQPLYRIEDDSYRFAMEQSEAALDLARESLSKARNISRPELLERLEATVQQRRSSLEKAESDAARYAALFDDGAVPLSRKEDADLALSSAKAQLKIAEKNLEEARTGARAEDRAAAEAAVRQAEAAFRLARDTWEKTVIRSPLTGTVAAKKAFAGDTARPGMAVAEIVDLSSFRIEIGVSADDVAYFHPGMSVTVESRSGGAAVPAHVRDVGVKADEATGSFPVIVEMKNPDAVGDRRTFRAGSDVTVSYTTVERPGSIVVPTSSLLSDVEAVWAFVADGKTARKRDVTVALEWEGESLVAGGLDEGDVLVVVGQHQLRDGDGIELTFE